jgi:hypothetical protein
VASGQPKAVLSVALGFHGAIFPGFEGRKRDISVTFSRHGCPAPLCASATWPSLHQIQMRTIFLCLAHRYGKRFIVRADEKLTAFLELETAVYASPAFETRD